MAIEPDRLTSLAGAERIISAAPVSKQEEAFERALRPKMLDEYIEVVRLVALRSARNRAEILRRLKSRALKDNRLDDADEDTIRRRLDVYDKESKPVLAYYPKELRADVDSLQTPIEVAHDILSAILGRKDELRAVEAPAGRT